MTVTANATFYLVQEAFLHEAVAAAVSAATFHLVFMKRYSLGISSLQGAVLSKSIKIKIPRSLSPSVKAIVFKTVSLWVILFLTHT